jgi:type III pantothenate kinase
MDLMIDIGNTHTVLGLFVDNDLLQNWRISSHASRTEDEYWAVVESLFKALDIDLLKIQGVCISSVVPELTLTYKRMIDKYLNLEPLLIDSDLDLGMKVLYQDPYSVGADRLCNAVAAKEKYGSPLIILDFGTATTFDCINEEGDYLGGVICPGIESAASVLHQKAAKLPKIELMFPPQIIGRNTVESMQSGIMFGSVKLIEGLLKEIKEQLGQNTKVIATGGLAQYISKRVPLIDQVEINLILEGIYSIYKRNHKRHR